MENYVKTKNCPTICDLLLHTQHLPLNKYHAKFLSVFPDIEKPASSLYPGQLINIRDSN